MLTNVLVIAQEAMEKFNIEKVSLDRTMSPNRAHLLII